MKKSIMISIQKEHCDNIFSGKKRWEGRKTLPSNVEIANYIDNTSTYNPSDKDVKFYVYQPKKGGGCGKVVGEFVCDFAQTFNGMPDWKEIARALCVSVDFAIKYFNKGKGYMIRVNEPKRYDKPKELSEFYGTCKKDKCKYPTCTKVFACSNYLKRPPQSWQFVERLKHD